MGFPPKGYSFLECGVIGFGIATVIVPSLKKLIGITIDDGIL
jgi:hypothetical protein